MSQSDEERTTPPSMLVRADEIQQQIQQLSGRDLQLWSIGILVMLVLTSGLLALILPNLVWSQLFARIDRFYLPQLFFGLISLVLLFNIYLLSQKRTLNSTRLALIRELVLNERLESLSLIDPLTQLLNRRALNELLPREVARANRLGSSLTFMAIDLNGFSAISSKYGALEGDKVLVDFAKNIEDRLPRRRPRLPPGWRRVSDHDAGHHRRAGRLPGSADPPGIGAVEPGQQEGLRTLVQLGPGPLCHRLRRRRCFAGGRSQDVFQET